MRSSVALSVVVAFMVSILLEVFPPIDARGGFGLVL
jgi:hypothetical protein